MWEKDGESIVRSAIVISIIAAIVCIGWGICEWCQGVAIAEKEPTKLQNLGSLGSYLQGSVSSLWALAGFFIIFVAFLVQAIQFTEQRKQFKLQSDSVARQNFESRFFGLLDYHRQNVSEIGIDEKTGRRVFVSLIREFRLVFETVNRVCDATNQYPKSNRLELAYLAFYYGIGPNSTRILKDVDNSMPADLVENLLKEMCLIQDFARTNEANRQTKFGIDYTRLQKIYSAMRQRISYIPFDGHQSRLGHYYRHMFQLVVYLDQQAPLGTQKEYAGIFRAQLTNHEQALLCLNALSSLGSPWITRGYLVNYALIKNIPNNFFDPNSELDVKARFPEITFEYERGNDPNRDTNP
jgi:hypothetical protein